MATRAIPVPIMLKACPCVGSTGRFEHGFAYLLSLMVVMLVVYPMSEDGFGGALVYAILLTLTLMLGASQAAWKTRDIWLALLFGILADVSILTEGPLASTPLWHHLLTSAAHLAFFIQVTRLIVVRILAGERITTDHLYGAACGYMLLAITWIPAFLIVAALNPHAFSGSAYDPAQLSWQQMLYFSFATLTTLGFGDIVPVSNLARSAVVMEAVTGNLYLALLIGRLAGLHVNGVTIRSGSGGES